MARNNEKNKNNQQLICFFLCSYSCHRWLSDVRFLHSKIANVVKSLLAYLRLQRRRQLLLVSQPQTNVVYTEFTNALIKHINIPIYIIERLQMCPEECKCIYTLSRAYVLLHIQQETIKSHWSYKSNLCLLRSDQEFGFAVVETTPQKLMLGWVYAMYFKVFFGGFLHLLVWKKCVRV